MTSQNDRRETFDKVVDTGILLYYNENIDMGGGRLNGITPSYSLGFVVWAGLRDTLLISF